MESNLPSGVPAEAASTARDTLGGALEAAAQLASRLASELVGAAQDAFTDRLHLTAAISTLLTLALASLVITRLRHITPGTTDETEPESVTLEPALAEPLPAEG